ncbi:MAG: T9SS type A sorting domain-containing protein, partial [candidate division Zixibacteria bacterium]|nr:T9SS type A sorting domain-containing protein [candidate division Zixibacteria bacterium]
GYAYAVEISDSIIYVADQGIGLKTYTLGDTLNPTLRNTHLLSGDCMDIAIKNDYLYMACGASGMVVFGLADPLAPDSVKTYDTPGFLNQITLVDTFAYLADETGGMLAYSISSPGDPYLIGRFNSPGTARGTAPYGDFVILADGDSVFVTANWFPNAVEESGISLPQGLELTGCYPNPFNSTTQIEFELASPTIITLDIYDICGRKIVNIVKGEFTAGKHSASWDASGMTSGVYFIRLNNGSKTTTKTITYLK